MLQALRDDPDKDVRQVALCTFFCLEGMEREGKWVYKRRQSHLLVNHQVSSLFAA